LTIAVRTLVEHVLRSGDLRIDFFGSARAVEGTRIHQQIQNRRPEGYLAEVSVSHMVESDDFSMCISGRIDGVLSNGDRPLIEEIKSTQRPLDDVAREPDPMHWGQVQCYAYMWAVQEGADQVDLRLTYVHVASGEVRELLRTFGIKDLAAIFNDLVERYRRWILGMVQWAQNRDQSIARTVFPFKTYRPGQRDMAVEVYRRIRDGGQLLAQAATGIGKTMAVLFPAIKALGEGLVSKIVFLTARTTGRLAAEAALAVLRDNGLKLKAVSLTAKEKVCFEPQSACLPEECPFARGFFDRINGAVEAAFQFDALNRETIETVARQFQVCPFELSLELVLWADCIIGDYNYAFDPRVTLQRLFQEDSGPKVILVDEAHNLVDRSRDMFSARLDKQSLLELRRKLKNDLPSLYHGLGRINSWLATQRRHLREAGESGVSSQAPHELVERVQAFARSAENWLAKNIRTPFRDDLMQLYFDCIRFLRVAENYDERYATLSEGNKEVSIRLFCIDPSDQLQTAWEQCKAAVLFSATLTPMNYYQDLLGCNPQTGKLKVASPFPAANLAVLAALQVSTYYHQRQLSCLTVSRMIGALIAQHQGHYLVFFPSYTYLRMVAQAFADEFGYIELLTQTSEMSESERLAFLERFKEKVTHTLVGFAVMGGVFGEGIDLKGDRLTGAVIVGVGLPAICLERDVIRNYFDQHKGQGFAYAYQYPGINRVLQAAGRVIRSGSDRGAVLLIDQRYAQTAFRCLLPSYWQVRKIKRPQDIKVALDEFWKG
jgi:DNA excision repair protein ERCC-2